MKDVGLKNYYNTYNLLIIIFFVISLLFTIIFWAFVDADADAYADSMARYGVEVEAKITKYSFFDGTDDEGRHYSYWRTYYSYVDGVGRVYSGDAYTCRSKEDADNYIGKVVKVTVNPKTGKSSMRSLSYFKIEKDGLRVHLIHAYVFSLLLLIFAFELFYRVVYRTNINKKIVNSMKSGFITRGTVDGEVVRTFGVIWFYVKIKCVDEFGIPHEKWSGDWFTRREATYLSEKRYVKIVQYKNIYGIMEEMPYKKYRKRKINEQ